MPQTPLRQSGRRTTVFELAALLFSSTAVAKPNEESSSLAKAPNITLRAGDLAVRMRPATAWTFNEIAFKDNALTTPGSFTGLVLNFGAGKFLGSGHKEAGGEEKVLSIQLKADGEAANASGGGTITGKTVELIKESELFTTHLKSVLRLRGSTPSCREYSGMRAIPHTARRCRTRFDVCLHVSVEFANDGMDGKNDSGQNPRRRFFRQR
jgi:hypothetical protein